MKQDNDAVRFSTVHEIRFIENIGLDKFGGMVIQDRKALLTNYIKAAEKRSDWGNVDKDIVISTAKKLLREAMN